MKWNLLGIGVALLLAAFVAHWINPAREYVPTIVELALIVFGIATIIYATHRTPGMDVNAFGINWGFGYSKLKAFFSTGVFHIILGCLFLYAAAVELSNAHSAFVFLLAILGVAIVLFGTGTQSAGDANTGKIKIAIAGGAGALAVLLGFGVLSYSDDIQKVFKRNVDYGILELYDDGKSGSTSATANFNDFVLRAALPGGRPLHLWNNARSVQIIVPIIVDPSQVTVSVIPVSRNNYKEWEKSVERSYSISWKSVPRQYGFNNEIVPLDRQHLQLISIDLPVQPQDEASNVKLPALTVTPR